ncbi:plasmid maintenance protein [Borrelia puertoricensis]|uniref:plasmid maintenance protein n=1 Tax=Borrelia puertoricensis TaxID=2756107 RepID=UPI001FF6653F|nr:plasmid maintenance protein [Borrelia puertoricensis]UPA19173.1 hypothetical protein bpuSUM_001733 [Borrelia puertoricensis]
MKILKKSHNKEQKKFNKHQHKLIVLISTLNYMNLNLKKYTQSNILYYFNNNLKRNGQKIIKIKTLQSYLYKLEKELQITINYYKHLGKNYGTEIYYQLKYPKNKCYHKINLYFKIKREKKFNERVHKYLCSKNINEEKWECISNIYNNIYNMKTKEKLNKTHKNHKYKTNKLSTNKKYKDQNKTIKSIKGLNKNTKDNIRNNIFSILLEQLKQKADTKTLVPILKHYLDKTNNLNYDKIINNQYYYDLLEILGKS